MKIYLVDNSEDGHHLKYEDALLTIPNCNSERIREKFLDIKKNPLKAINQRRKFLKNYSFVKNSIIHLLHLDSLYKVPHLVKYISKQNNTLIATLHWYPHRKIDMLLLKKSAKYIKIIVVHSDFIKQELNNNDIMNVKVVNYPAFVSREEIDEATHETFKKDEIIISCIGGTRKDKGLDVLINALEFIDDKAKEKIFFNIVGREEEIKYKGFIDKANENNIKYKVENRIVTYNEYWANIISSDIILLPYTKAFRGNSGPMTDGAYLGKYILSSDCRSIRYILEKYKLGKSFVVEDSNDLARKINLLGDKEIFSDSKLRKQFGVNIFLESYKKIYKYLGE